MTADQIREMDSAFHPLIQAGINLVPASKRPMAIQFDSWLYGLIQTPGVLEQVLTLFPVGGIPVPVGDPSTFPTTTDAL